VPIEEEEEEEEGNECPPTELCTLTPRAFHVHTTKIELYFADILRSP